MNTIRSNKLNNELAPKVETLRDKIEGSAVSEKQPQCYCERFNLEGINETDNVSLNINGKR